ncbi:hypothetical protein [uncultured Metabacillus sp.]|uniref:hypothetical protein n=1 Tax=uncultured Metabacillus sp. TaxID=2860135 RepID=UPI002616ECB5|nr:hypothetical protein [uncultured Metabacillus sp.]
MATDYQLVFDRFIRKLKGDKQFFNYGSELLESEVDEIINDHLNSLLNRAIDKLYEYGLPDFDFYDKDDTLQIFNGDLVKQEISLLSDLMYLSYFEEDINKLKAFGLRLRSSEINALFSPANDRKTFMEMVEKIEFNVVNSIANYLSRDRISWEIKSIYDGV